MERNLLRVHVEPPVCDGETVVFRWTQSTLNQFQRINQFFFRYEGIETACYSQELWHEIFLGLQLRVFAAHPGPVEIVFTTPVPRPTIDYWRAFHDAAHVEISPVAGIDSYDPWMNGQKLKPFTRSAVIFFGGGKDSTLAACLLGELEGAEQVLLVQYVGPLRPDPELTERLEQRQQTLMLQPTAQRLGAAPQRVWTDFQAQFNPEGYHLRPNLELYTLGALPALLAWNASICTFSMPWTNYSTHRGQDGAIKHRYSRSRPEELSNLSRHYHRALKFPLTVTNITFPLASHLVFQLLAKRYPHAVDGIVSCTQGDVNQRWCYRCEKCWGIALWSLSCGSPLGTFDYDHFFRRSWFARTLVEFAESGVELSSAGNAPWQPFISTERGYDLVCSMIARIDPANLPPIMGDLALSNVALLRALFGNRPAPEFETVSRPLIRMLGPELESRLTPLIAKHFKLTDELPAPPTTGKGAVTYELDGAFTPRTSSVAHIRGEND